MTADGDSDDATVDLETSHGARRPPRSRLRESAFCSPVYASRQTIVEALSLEIDAAAAAFERLGAQPDLLRARALAAELRGTA